MVSEGFSGNALTVVYEVIKKYSVYDEDDTPPVEAVVSGFSGIDAAGWAAKRLGIKPALAMDGWDESIKTIDANLPGRHEKVWFGDDDKGSVENVLGMIHEETTDKDGYAAHFSPPCDKLSRANQFKDRNDNAATGMEMIDFTSKVFDGLRSSEQPPAMLSMEQTPEARKYILDDSYGLNQNLSNDFKTMVRNSPNLESGQFGSPTFRERLWSVRGSEATPTHSKDNYASINDFFPYMQEEWERSGAKTGNTGKTRGRAAELQHLREQGKVDQRAFDMLSEPTISAGGSVNPGKGGAPWNDDKKGYAWNHIPPTSRPMPAVTHHRPALSHTRHLTPQEVLQIQGWTKEESEAFKWPQARGETYKLPSGNPRNIIDTQLGNTMSPNIYQNLLENIGRGQKELF